MTISQRAGRGGRDDRAAGGERLDEREPERLALGAVQQAVGLGQRRARVIERAEEADAAGEVRPRRPLVQRGGELLRVAGQRRAGDVEPQLRPEIVLWIPNLIFGPG